MCHLHCAWCGYRWLSVVANFKDYETSLHQFTKSQYKTKVRGRRGCMVVGLPMQSVPITTKVVGLNPVHGKVYSIQHCWIKFVNDLLQDQGRRFSPGTPVSSTNKTDHHELTEILLKVALNTINLKPIRKQTWCLYTMYDNMIFYRN